jgi:hypothetical protein
MALVVGRYEGLFTLISPYNKGHKCIKEQPEAISRTGQTMVKRKRKNDKL